MDGLFGLQASPPFASLSKSAHHNLGEAREFPTCGVIVVAAAHAGWRNVSSLYVVRDAVLVRMLPLLMRR